MSVGKRVSRGDGDSCGTIVRVAPRVTSNSVYVDGVRLALAIQGRPDGLREGLYSMSSGLVMIREEIIRGSNRLHLHRIKATILTSLAGWVLC